MQAVLHHFYISYVYHWYPRKACKSTVYTQSRQLDLPLEALNQVFGVLLNGDVTIQRP
jgi:hypothetical protein